jgi:hypothetical protein
MSTTNTTVSPTVRTSIATTPDPIRVEPRHLTRWVVGGVAVALVAGAGVVGVRAYGSSQDTSVPSPATAVPRTDRAESAHGSGAGTRTGLGQAMAGAGSLTPTTTSLTIRDSNDAAHGTAGSVTTAAGRLLTATQ